MTSASAAPAAALACPASVPYEGADPHEGTPFSRDLGIDVLELTPGRAVLALAWQPRLTNTRGAMHGGALSTLADMALSLAWRLAAPDRIAAGTISLNLNFVAPATRGVRAVATLAHLAGGCAFCEAHVLDEAEQLIATAQGVFRLRRRPVGPIEQGA